MTFIVFTDIQRDIIINDYLCGFVTPLCGVIDCLWRRGISKNFKSHSNAVVH